MSVYQKENHEILVGVVSDTHGSLPDKVLSAFEGVDLIIHAGDFNTPQILEKLNHSHQVRAVRGNMDNHDELKPLPLSEVVKVGEVFIYVIHDLLDMDIDPDAAGFDVVVHGHLHVPEVLERQGVIYVNPGSPTSPRMGSNPGIARLRINGKQVHAELIAI